MHTEISASPVFIPTSRALIYVQQLAFHKSEKFLWNGSKGNMMKHGFEEKLVKGSMKMREAES